jgi:hypothetical protein
MKMLLLAVFTIAQVIRPYSKEARSLSNIASTL